jgi:hypothetical protein
MKKKRKYPEISFPVGKQKLNHCVHNEFDYKMTDPAILCGKRHSGKDNMSEHFPDRCSTVTINRELLIPLM